MFDHIHEQNQWKTVVWVDAEEYQRIARVPLVVHVETLKDSLVHKNACKKEILTSILDVHFGLNYHTSVVI